MELKTLVNLIRRTLEGSPGFQYAESITGTNSWIIAFLAENSEKDIFQKDLEKKLSVNRSTASKVIKRMETIGLIERQSVASDGRLKKLVLTDRALKIHDAIVSDLKRLEAALIKGFTDEELKNLCHYLTRMKSNLGKLQESREQ